MAWNFLRLPVLQLSGACALLILAGVGCSSGPAESAIPANSGGNWLSQGSIVVASPLPPPASPSTRSMLGFLPADVDTRGKWLSIDTHQGVMTFMEGQKTLFSSKIKAAGSVPAGRYELAHKQKDALWHATDDYFNNRHLPLPAAGDQSRYLRGALGEYVLYLNRELPLHNAPVWTPEIGGIQLSDEDIARVYYQLDLGAAIEVN